MRIGIIAEFNPLHSGHEFLIDQAKNFLKLNNGSGEIICVMSEFFTQRGEVAIINGYKRARVAVLAACDLVLALPYRASVAYSDDFAKKSIEILVACGISHLIFGSEIDIALFENIYKAEQEESTLKKIKDLTKLGYSYPKIMAQLFNIPKDSPNFILAYSYYKTLQRIAPHIKLIAVKRRGQALNEEKLVEKEFLSATSIRKNIDNDFINSYLSNYMLEELATSKKLSEKDFYSLIKYEIISLGKEGLKNIYDITEGLENRIYEANLLANNYEELVNLISSKRYSKKRVSRILINILTKSTKKEMQAAIRHVRALVVKKDKTYLIREINNKNKIYIHQKLKKNNAEFFEHDIRVSRIYNLYSKDRDIFKNIVELI
ncbi:nucleotidyltransferase family protein [Gemella sp. zg-1178]|uniref:nucleotidyltransferase family protein n=1 Tax=Gemella sp. zg-1178 TaxID=2840372 RepID=UPI001C03B86F|nr:nucleotidyltransferase family protein [Gemella sp. zg-1178]MBU0278143.1 nucleotidyltransferase family protein [Gemella sp. zg-1178]